MKKIIPLQPGKQGPEVADLQDALRLFLNRAIILVTDEIARRNFTELLKPERAEQVYKDVTRKLVSIFQEERRLDFQEFGAVDATTANEINALLREFGVLEDEGWTKVVEALNTQGQTLKAINIGTDHLASIDEKIAYLGKASSSLSLNMRGDEVKNLHSQLTNIGVVLPASEKEGAIFGVGTRDVLLQLQAKLNLARTGVYDDATRNALAIVVGNATNPRRVEGRIFLDNGLPASKIKLNIVNKGFGDNEKVLGEIETDERGFYALPYDIEEAAAHLEIRAFDELGNNIRLSNPKFNADRSEVLNLIAPSTVKTQANEFKLLSDDLGKIVGTDLSNLALTQENDLKQDLSLLHQETDWNAKLIATAATAVKMKDVTGIQPDALYGAYRAGLPFDDEALAIVRPEAFATALKEANKAGVINLNDVQMADANKAFEVFAIQKRRTMVVPGTLSNIDEMLNKMQIEPAHKDEFVRLLWQHEGDDDTLWDEAKKKGMPVADLQLQGKLAYLTMNNALLTEALQTEIGSHENLAKLVEMDLYNKKVWETRLKVMATENENLNPEKLASLIPTAYNQEKIEERLEAYADDLARRVRDSFPTHVINRMLTKDEMTLGDRHNVLKAPVNTFLKNAVEKGFELGRTPVEQFLKQHGETVFEGIIDEKDKQHAKEGVKLLARTYQMTPNDESQKILLSLGFTSAMQVAAIPKDEFVSRYWKIFGSRTTATVIWDKSTQITSSTFNIYTMGKKLDSTPPVRVISGSPDKHKEDKEKLLSMLKEYPTMETLFGSLDYCECDHCRSVLSPAAYYVDLLRFIDPPEHEWKLTLDKWKDDHKGKPYEDYNYLKPYDALILRRPDLPHLPLTCENTTTALPYIDLVNEILEYYVANGEVDPDAVRDTGGATSAELMAEPYNIIPEAYDILKGAKYPLTLPFDLWLETVRRFCAYFETPLWQILDVFRPSEQLFAPEAAPEAYDRSRIYAEYLGVTPSEYDIYTKSTFTDWLVLYGYDKPSDTEADTLSALKSAKILSRRLGVTYKELVELVKTTFVNPGLKNLVTLHKLDIDAQDVFKYKKLAGLASLTSEEEEELNEFEKRLTKLTEKFASHFDAKQWLNAEWDAGHFSKIIVLRDEDAGCNFDKTEVLFADGSDVDRLTFTKLNLFVRLWKRLGWTIEETDLALHAFMPSNVALSDATLGQAMKTSLIYIAHLQQLTELVNVGQKSRFKLISLWMPNLPTHSKNSLYAQFFLTRNILKDDQVFDNPLGNYLSKPGVFVKDHLPALQAALNLTADEIAQILLDGNAENVQERDLNQATLSLTNVSMLHRYGLLSKALKLSISDLIALKMLNGLNPFHPLHPDALDIVDHDFPFTHTLEFVRVAQQVKASSFSIEDLDYLFRHQVDPQGKYREDISGSRLGWIRTLAAELRKISSDFAVPGDAESVSDDALREKLALVYAPDVVELFMSFWQDTAIYSVIRKPVQPNQRLNPAIYGVNGISVMYDETREQQQVTHTGVLTAAARANLLSQIPEPSPDDVNGIAARTLFSEMLEEIGKKSNAQFKALFDKYFDGLLQFEEFFESGVARTPQIRLDVLKKILPFLQKKLTRLTILQSVTKESEGNPAMVEVLLTNSSYLSLPDANDKSLMERIEGLEKRGLSKELTPSDSNEPIQRSSSESIEVKEEEKCKEAIWKGFIEVPQNGAYRFYAKLGKQGAKVELRVDHLIVPISKGGTAERDGDELSGFVELKSGVLYAFELKVSNLQNGTFQMLVKGETTPKEPFNRLVAIPQSESDGASQAFTMLTKALQLAQGMSFSGRDLSHILAHPADFGGVDWRMLPTHETNNAQSVQNTILLFNGFIRLLNYSVLKRDMAGGSDDFITIFERARQNTSNNVQELSRLIAEITRRKPETVQAVAAELKMSVPVHFAEAVRMERLWIALQIVEKFGVSMDSLKKWLTPKPNAEVAMDVRNTVKARFEQETWQNIAKGIFDPLRQRKRDALAAYIMYLKPELVSIEKMFEYFLIDPGTEPVVQTSRLRLAISSLQTFIQRCFLNLEPRVHSSVLNAQHWSWMKRYRVWEANRKIFLFPENWCEPEWRDDKTHIFQELESSLLQGDITNQLAEDALYIYLSKLEKLARLEIVTMYAEERGQGLPPIMHVIGRNSDSPRQYFYRRYAYQMWTPWEPVTAEIEGDHIVAVMWRGQLRLFWLNIMEFVKEQENSQVSQQTGNQPPGFTGMSVDAVVTAARSVSKGVASRELGVQLNWSEYYQGKWTERQSSGFIKKITFNKPFDDQFKSNLFVTVSKEDELETGGEGAVIINIFGLGDGLNHYFRVVSKNSLPQPDLLDEYPPDSPYSKIRKNNRYEGSGALSVDFDREINTSDGVKQTKSGPQSILSQVGNYSLLLPSNRMKYPNEEFAPLISPMFYTADDLYTYFVEPTLTETTRIDKWKSYTYTLPSLLDKWSRYLENPTKVSPNIPYKYRLELFKNPDIRLQPDPNPLAKYDIKPNIDTLTQPGVAVKFGNVMVGSTGRIQDLSGIKHVVTSVGGINLRQ